MAEPVQDWQAWIRRPIPPDVREAYQKWRMAHELGDDFDPTSIEARYWWLGGEAERERASGVKAGG